MTSIKKIPSPEAFECIWCKRKIAAGAPSLAVEVDGTRLFFCEECGKGVQETRPPTVRERVADLAKTMDVMTSATVADALGLDPIAGRMSAGNALRDLWREGFLVREPGKSESKSLCYEYRLA